MVLDSLKIFLLLSEPHAYHGEATTARGDGAREIEAPDGAFWKKAIRMILLQNMLDDSAHLDP